jgi:hypothetical protein
MAPGGVGWTCSQFSDNTTAIACLSRSTRSSAGTCLPRRPRRPRSTVCASLRRTRSSPSLASGTSCGASSSVCCPHSGHSNNILGPSQLKKVKKANGEIIGVNTVSVPSPAPPYPLQPMQEAGGTGALTGRPPLRALLSPDPREEAAQGQELRHLDPLRLALGHAQHVQGVPRALARGRRARALPGHGCASPCPLPVDPRAPSCLIVSGTGTLTCARRSSASSRSRSRRTCAGRTSSS